MPLEFKIDKERMSQGKTMTWIIDNDELMKVFYEEARELIDKMKNDLSTLNIKDKKRGDAAAVETGDIHVEKEGPFPTFRNLFRYAHTLKSSSRAVGFDKLEEVTQALERIFKEAEISAIDIDKNIISILSEGVEICGKLLKKEKVSGYKSLLAQLESITCNRGSYGNEN
jgi:chemotaxis protein histidine kinase CheA